MAKSIASYPKKMQKEVIARRLASETGGLGYLAAKDAQTGVIRRQLIEQGLIKPVEKQA